MSQGLASLHRILKDETRQKIITLLNNKGSLGYSDLMEQSEVLSRGLLNYHLKVLGNLIQKNESGQYLLTEKGRLASRLLAEFPEESYQLNRRKRQKQLWTIVASIQIVTFITIVTLYYANLVNSEIVITSTVWTIGSIFLAYFGYKLQIIPRTKTTERKAFMISYLLSGIVIGGFFALFGTALISYISTSIGGPNLLRLIGPSYLHVVSYLLLFMAIGVVVGYFVGKRRSFTQPKWAKWLEDHFG